MSRLVDGSVLPLIFIKKAFSMKYCPQNIDGFYRVIYQITPVEDLVRYCPQDITDFYLP